MFKFHLLTENRKFANDCRVMSALSCRNACFTLPYKGGQSQDFTLLDKSRPPWEVSGVQRQPRLFSGRESGRLLFLKPEMAFEKRQVGMSHKGVTLRESRPPSWDAASRSGGLAWRRLVSTRTAGRRPRASRIKLHFARGQKKSGKVKERDWLGGILVLFKEVKKDLFAK